MTCLKLFSSEYARRHTKVFTINCNHVQDERFGALGYLHSNMACHMQNFMLFFMFFQNVQSSKSNQLPICTTTNFSQTVVSCQKHLGRHQMILLGPYIWKYTCSCTTFFSRVSNLTLTIVAFRTIKS